MGVKDLLLPRFMLIATYPGCTREVGSVSVEVSTADYFRQYPTNFKELRWWQDRKPDELPKYVKDKTVGNVVVEVAKWDDWYFISQSNWNGTDGYKSNPAHWLPATEAEFNNRKINH